ncbi:retrovirus-related pol polyprotein from transposon TNT 1-94 [Tanacetum coccineum]|uniref:Retrovirus-related pol polyprotein from transposon TNT 1-94 n=1 Tax=Tanacetum coccineum TaxID=301880 RepID=A0ABQ5BQY6_9ASTR
MACDDGFSHGGRSSLRYSFEPHIRWRFVSSSPTQVESTLAMRSGQTVTIVGQQQQLLHLSKQTLRGNDARTFELVQGIITGVGTGNKAKGRPRKWSWNCQTYGSRSSRVIILNMGAYGCILAQPRFLFLRQMVNTRQSTPEFSGPAFDEAVQRAVNALLPGLTTQITNELRQNGAGGSVDAKNWIAHIEKLFEVLGCADEFKARLASYKLEGDALSWWKAVKQAKGGETYVATLPWKDFRELFFLQYFPRSEQQKYEREYHTILQRDGEPSGEFMKRFLRLAGFLGKKAGTQEEQAKNFKWALCDWILDGIVNTEFTDVAQVANAARNIEILCERSSQNNKRNRDGDRIRPMTQGNNQRGYDQKMYDGRRCNSDQKSRHNRGQQYNRSSGPSGQKVYPDYASSPPCDICGKLHPGKACYRVTGACFIYGLTGHMARDCPKNGGNGGRGYGNDNQPAAKGRVFSSTKDQATNSSGTYIPSGVALDEEQLLFIAGGQDNAIDEDVDEQPVQDLALNVDNVFQADDCDAFDSDVDEAPTAQTMFMANLSSADPVYDEAGPSYDSDILSEVHDHDHYQDAVCEHHEEHEMHDDVQPNYVVDSHANYTSDSNMIPYDQYVKDNAVPVVQSNVSSVPNDAYMMIFNDMHEPHAQSVSDTTRNTVVDNSLTAELATYKEQVELYERRARFELTEREQKIDEQLRIVITDRNIKEENLKKELHFVKMQLASTINHNKSIVEEVTSLKKDFKQKENKYLEEFLDMKALKEKVEDKLYKQDQSLQTVHMLCKPKPYYNEQNKVAIGYKNPLCLTHAKQVQPALYTGYEIIRNNHVPDLVHNTEDTLEIAEITRRKMNDKMKDPECVTHKVNIAPPDYSKENYLATFTPQKQLTPEQIFWSQDLIKMKEEALKKQTTTSRPIKALMVYLPNTPAMLVPRVLPIKKMKDIFEELEAEVDQNVVNRKHDEIERKNLLIANDNLIADCLSKEVFYIAMNSELTVSRFTEMHETHTIVQTCCLELEAELSKLRDKRPVVKQTVLLIQEQNELFRAENEKVKQHYKELYDSIKITRAKHIEQTTALLTENENLKAQIHENLKCNTMESVKPRVLAPGRYAIDVEPIPPHNRNNREVHLHYLKHLKESVETLREIVEEAKVERPLDRSIVSACRYTKHSQELLEYAIGTCPKAFNQRDKKHAPTSLIRKKQVTFEEQCDTSNSNTHKHVEQLNTQKTNVPVPPSTGVNCCTNASGSQPRSNTKKNRISPAKGVNKKKVEEHPRTNKSNLRTTNRVDSSSSSKRCSKHMMGDRSWLRNFVKKFIGTVRFRNDHFGAIMGYGDYVIGDCVISRVYYVEGLEHNLFFVRQFCHSDLEVAFRKHSCYVRDTDGVELIKGSRGSNLYTISVEDMMKSSPICLLSKASKNKSWLWHRRLNHLNFGTINDLARKDLVRGLPRLKFEKDHLCSACQLGKSKKHTHKPKTKNTNLEVLNTLHMDLCGPMRVQTINGKKYILVIVDDYSQFTWVKFLRLKDETLETVPRTPQQNDIVKRRNRTLVEAARTMLIFSKAPMFLWAEVVATACYTQNRSLIHTLHNKTPYELVHDKNHDLTFFCVFDALCYPTNDSEDLGKLQPTADIKIFVGYAPSRKGSGIVPNPVPAAPYVPPINKELEILFQPMFDEYLKPTRVERPVSPVPAVSVSVTSAGTPSSTTIDQDAPFPSHSPSSLALQSPSLHQGVAVESTLMENNPFAPVDNDPFINIFAPEPTFEASSSGI